MKIEINGKQHELSAGATVVQALALIGLSADQSGVAVALNDKVIPRSRWSEQELAEGARIEVVTAAQGG